MFVLFDLVSVYLQWLAEVDSGHVLFTNALHYLCFFRTYFYLILNPFNIREIVETCNEYDRKFAKLLEENPQKW